MSSNSAAPAEAPQQSPEALIWEAVDTDSSERLEAAFDRVRSIEPSYMPDMQREAFGQVLQLGSIPLTKFMLSRGYAKVQDIRAKTICNNISIPFLECLLDHGWDINTTGTPDSREKGMRIIDELVDNEEMVVWLVGHGARVDGGDLDAVVDPRPPALLETCAARGSLKTFKFLQEKGAKLGKRTLHVAALRGAIISADPTRDYDDEGTVGPSDDDKNKNRRDVEALLRYLVDELRLDVNKVEFDIPWQYGTPINHAAAKPKGAAVVRWLLQKGADPHKYVRPEDYSIKVYRGSDAEGFASQFKCNEVLEVLSEWSKRKAEE